MQPIPPFNHANSFQDPVVTTPETSTYYIYINMPPNIGDGRVATKELKNRVKREIDLKRNTLLRVGIITSIITLSLCFVPPSPSGFIAIGISLTVSIGALVNSDSLKIVLNRLDQHPNTIRT
jgi:hypothetical protein